MSGIDYPITVEGIDFDSELPAYIPRGLGGECGQWVSVKPVSDEKTYLGIYLGEIARGPAFIHQKNGRLKAFVHGHNPAIYVPDLGRIVFGYESWWGRINSPDELRKITDSDIENVWYVKALRSLEQANAS